MLEKLFYRKTKEELFWDWFLKNEAELYYGTDNERDRERIFDGLTKKIKAIDSNLAFEFSPIRANETKEFIVSADGMKESFGNVVSLIDKSPEHDHWEFLAFRQPNAGDGLSIKMGDFEIGYEDIFFRYAIEDEILNVELNIRGFDGSSHQQNAIFILLDSLLGEYDTTMEIGYIDWKVLEEEKIDNFYPFIELRKVISNRKMEKADNSG